MKYNDRYGNCFTFADNDDPEGTASQWVIRQPGPNHGLTLEMTIETEEYLPVSDTGGLLVIVHDPGERVYPEDGGLVVGPGFSASIGIQKLKSRRLQPPHGECEAKSKDDALGRMGNHTYSVQSCLKECQQLNVYANCECCLANIPCVEKTLRSYSNHGVGVGIIETCNMTVSEVEDCVTKVRTDNHKDDMACIEMCPPACEVTTYYPEISAGRWPTRAYESILKSKIVDASIDLGSGSFGAVMTDSFLRLHIYYNRLMVEHQSEEAVYSWSEVLGTIGGQLGLMLGFSVMTAVEILQLLLLDLGPCRWVAMLSKHRGRKDQAQTGVK